MVHYTFLSECMPITSCDTTRVGVAVIIHHHRGKSEKIRIKQNLDRQTLLTCIWRSPWLCEMIREESNIPILQSRQLWFRKISNLASYCLSDHRLVSGEAGPRPRGFLHLPGTAFPSSTTGPVYGKRGITSFGHMISWLNTWGTSPHQSGDILLGSQAVSVLKWMTVFKDDSPIIILYFRQITLCFRAAVPKFLAPGTSFVEENFSTD